MKHLCTSHYSHTGESVYPFNGTGRLVRGQEVRVGGLVGTRNPSPDFCVPSEGYCEKPKDRTSMNLPPTTITQLVRSLWAALRLGR